MSSQLNVDELIAAANKLPREDRERLVQSLSEPTRSQTETEPSSGNRARELQWRREHYTTLCAFAGEWVALEGEQIIAQGLDLPEVVAIARTHGVRIPYVFRIEHLADDTAAIGL